MLAYDPTTLTVLSSIFFAIAAVAMVASVAVLGGFVVTNRRIRLARKESIRTYYRGFALTH